MSLHLYVLMKTTKCLKDDQDFLCIERSDTDRYDDT